MFEFALPDLGEGVAEGEILSWHVDVGDAVVEDDVLLEVETDKAAVEVPSPTAGTVAERHGAVGETIETGAVIVTIDTDGEGSVQDEHRAEGTDGDEDTAEGDGEDASESAAAGNGRRVFAPPSVRRLARDLGVDISGVAGSGPSGRVTEEDVRDAAADEQAAAEEADEGTAARNVASASEESEGVKSAVRRISDDEGTEASDSPTGAADSTTDAAEFGAEAGEDDTAVKSAVRAASSTSRRERTLATPATRKLARELGVDVDAVPTDVTRDGEPFVDEGAVRSFAEREGERAAGPTADVAGESTTGATAEPADGPGPTDGEEGASVAHTEAYQGIRRRIGEQMALSRREVPHATHHDRVEVSELVAARERLQPLAEDRGVSLTYTPFILKCVGAALRDHPVINTRLDTESEEIHYLDSYHVGVATDTDRGLLVPVVRDVDERGIVELAEVANDLVEQARDGSIDRSAMQGATFTVTNVGAIGGEYADPIINVPQTAVLAVGSLRERPIALDGEVVAKPTLPLSLAIDHRVIDGADAARFTNTLKSYLADPTRLLLE